MIILAQTFQVGFTSCQVRNVTDYSSYGGLVAGESNAISAPHASIIGGEFNTASGSASSVSGGYGNTASSDRSHLP